MATGVPLASTSLHEPCPRAHDSGVEPLIAVVIPAYKQPQFLKDAVISAARQSLGDRTKIIIVDDGCPFASTGWLGRYFRDAIPGQAYYLRKPNGGLSSARNHGIRFALAAWPSIRAVFPLDADNKLLPVTLEKLWQALSSAPMNVGWAFQDLFYFGSDETRWHFDLSFSRYRLIHANYCEAGSLIRREVFEAGIWYDEAMKSGYEDWEFYINACLHGYLGVYAPDAGFLYRKRGFSMLSAAMRQHEAIVDYIWRKHAGSLQHNTLILLEHEEMPRFAMITNGAAKATYFTSPNQKGTYISTAASFADTLLAWAGEPQPEVTYVPPFTLFTQKDHWELLEQLNLLSGLLFNIQDSLTRATVATVTLAPAEDAYHVGMEREQAAAKPFLLAIASHRLVEWIGRQGGDPSQPPEDAMQGSLANIHIKLGRSFYGSAYQHLLSENSCGQQSGPHDWVRALHDHLADQAIARSSGTIPGQAFQCSHTEFARWRQMGSDPIVYPFCIRPENGSQNHVNIFFVTARFGLGEVERSSSYLSRRLAQLSSAYSTHLILTEVGQMAAMPEWLAAFDTVAWLPAGAPDRESALLDILSGADAIVNLGSDLAYQVLPAIKARRKLAFISHLAQRDVAPDGLHHAYPFLASRQYEMLIDEFLVGSETLKRYCLNFGAPKEKVRLLPPAPPAPFETGDAAEDAESEAAWNQLVTNLAQSIDTILDKHGSE